MPIGRILSRFDSSLCKKNMYVLVKKGSIDGWTVPLKRWSKSSRMALLIGDFPFRASQMKMSCESMMSPLAFPRGRHSMVLMISPLRAKFLILALQKY